jgi:hypothetical protein
MRIFKSSLVRNVNCAHVLLLREPVLVLSLEAKPKSMTESRSIVEQRSYRDGVFARRIVFFVWLTLCYLHLVSPRYP